MQINKQNNGGIGSVTLPGSENEKGEDKSDVKDGDDKK